MPAKSSKKAASKRALDDPGDISISVAPAPPKKSKAPANKKVTKTTKATVDPTSSATSPATSTPVAVLETATMGPCTRAATKPKESASLGDGSPTDATATTPATLATVVTTAATAKLRPKPKAPPPSDKLPVTETPAIAPTTVAKPCPKLATKSKDAAAGLGDGPTPVEADKIEPPVPTTKSGKRDKKLSSIAQKVQAQETTKKQAKDEKARKKAKKEEEAIIEETPEETAAFVERIRMMALPTPATSSAAVTARPRNPNVDRQKALEELINSHHPSPAASVISGMSFVSSATSSLAPSESISQRGAPIRNDPKPPKGKVYFASQPTLQIPPTVESPRDVSPIAKSIATVDEDKGPIDMAGFDLNKILRGIPPPFTIEIKMPDSLPPPLHTMRCKSTIETHDYTGLKGAERQRQRRKQEGYKISALHTVDQPVASLVLKRMDVLLTCCCAFPNDETTWVIANMANAYACKKLGRNYSLTRPSEYQKLLYSRIPQSRSKFVKPECAEGILAHYHFQTGLDNDALEYNHNHVQALMNNAAFTAPSFEQASQLYEHLFFEKLIRTTCFAKSTSKGLVNPDLFGTVTIPLMALVAIATEKMLMSYSTGLYRRSNLFSAEVFMPKYYSHLITLAQMYHLNKVVLSEYLNRPIANLCAPHTTALAVNPTSIRPSVPLSFINQQYAARSLPLALSSAASSTVSIKMPPFVPSSMSTHHKSATSGNLQSKILSVLNNNQLTTEEKASIVYTITIGNQLDRGSTTSTQPTQMYNNLLIGVNEGSSDSEVEARCAGAIPTARACTKMVAKIWGNDPDDSDAPAQVKGKGKAESDGAKGEDKDKDDEDGEGGEEARAEEAEAGEDGKDGEDGEGGEDGKDGKDGEDGEDGESDEDEGEGEGEGEGGEGGEEAERAEAEEQEDDSNVLTKRGGTPPGNSLSDPDPDPGMLSSDESKDDGTSGAVRPDHVVLHDGDLSMASIGSTE